MNQKFKRVIGPKGVVVHGRRLDCAEMIMRVGETVTLEPMDPPVFGELRAYFKDGKQAIAVMVEIADWLPKEKGKAEVAWRKLQQQRRQNTAYRDALKTQYPMYRVSQWIDTSPEAMELEQARIVYGVQTKRGKDCKWMHVAQGNKAMLFDSADKASAACEQLRQAAAGSTQ
jgi:hypothetical protein